MADSSSSQPVMLDELAITPVRVPDDVNAPEAADFRAVADVRNRVGAATRGADSVEMTPEQMLPHWRTTDEEVHGWLIRTRGAVAGRALMYIPLEEGSRRAQLRVELLPEFWGRGYGRRTLAFLEDRARGRGRDILQSWSEHTPADGVRIDARTGFGSIPLDRASRLMTGAGYSLEQVYRISTLDLTSPLDAIEPLREAASVAASAYRYVSWLAPTPDEWIDDYAWMKSRMSTDAPAGDAVWDEETWDADRIRRMEAQWGDSGTTTIVGAAQHLESGRLVAFTELVSFRVPGKPIEQNDTLVLSDHRGHRLGALVKTETLLRARELFPEGERIVTGNAEENRPMLAVNEAMGFTPTRYSGEWQKTVSL